MLQSNMILNENSYDLPESATENVRCVVLEDFEIG